MTTLHFYGDSWPAEHGELEEITLLDYDSYATITGRLLAWPVQNHAIMGTSQEHMIVQFLHSAVRAGDHAVFNLTAPSRRMGRGST